MLTILCALDALEISTICNRKQELTSTRTTKSHVFLPLLLLLLLLLACLSIFTANITCTVHSIALFLFFHLLV